MSFLQSEKWEQFQKRVGRETFRVGGILVIKHPLPYDKCWLYVPRVSQIDSPEQFLIKLKKLGQQQRAIFSKIEPATGQLFSQLKKINRFQISPTIQPQATLLLDLTLTPEELLAQMKSKTRYNIRLAIRHQIEVIEEKNMEHFWTLAQKTGQRDGFNYHPKDYYKWMLKTLTPNLKVLSAVRKEEVLASALVLFIKDTAYYLHGASDWDQRQLMASFQLHWEIIKLAQQKGCCWYDFYGVAVDKVNNGYVVQSSHPWAGITRFKLGFAPQGQVKEYPPALDLIFSPWWYKIYSLAKKLKVS